ncbi:MAG: SpoIIE family protein phosphatase [Chloroflexi bacterium]|nr:SpoIIE family protein phosphatase [Chloroflexota bacterium]
MTTFLKDFWQGLVRPGGSQVEVAYPPALQPRGRSVVAPVDIDPHDPVLAYFRQHPVSITIDKIELDTPGVRALKAAGVEMLVPLVSQGELVGLLNLGPRLSGQSYSLDDRRLLNNLASQAAPALRIAQLVRQQRTEALALERLEQELRVARLIQQTLLPETMPEIAGWQIAALYQPARAVGGDFYDFHPLPDGRLGIVIGDVTDKGMPAALVMATVRSILRAAAQGVTSPAGLLEKANNLLYRDIPSQMFVTCLYAILDPASGYLSFANAGQTPPYRHTREGVKELWATGVPLGMIPEAEYDDCETYLVHGESLLFYSDGLVEAHNSRREMFSFDRLEHLLSSYTGGAALIQMLLAELEKFTGPGWEQEDDVTLLTVHRSDVPCFEIA